MNLIEIELDYFPDSIIEVIVNSTKDSFVNIEELKNSNYIIKIKDLSYGPFSWDEKFTKDKVFKNKNNDNLLFLKIDLCNEILFQTYSNFKNDIIKIEEKKLSKSKYLYLVNSLYHFNHNLLSLNLEEIERFQTIFSENLTNLLDFEFLISLKKDFIIFDLSENLQSLPFQFFSYELAKNGILPLFLVNNSKNSSNFINSFDLSFILSFKENLINSNDLIFLKENGFEFNKTLWDKNNLNKIIFSDKDQFLSGINIGKIPIILAHGYRKKDFSSIKIGKNFFNPFYLNHSEKIPKIIFLLCCMINYSKSENNLIHHFFERGSKLILSSPFILPIEFVEDIFETIMKKEYNNLYELLIKLLSISKLISTLLKIFI